MSTKLLTLNDLAERWSVSRKVVLRMVREADIPFVIVGQTKSSLNQRGPKSYRFRPEVIDRWEQERESTYRPAKETKSTSASRGRRGLPPIDPKFAKLFR